MEISCNKYELNEFTTISVIFTIKHKICSDLKRTVAIEFNQAILLCMQWQCNLHTHKNIPSFKLLHASKAQIIAKDILVYMLLYQQHTACNWSTKLYRTLSHSLERKSS